MVKQKEIEHTLDSMGTELRGSQAGKRAVVMLVHLAKRCNSKRGGVHLYPRNEPTGVRAVETI